MKIGQIRYAVAASDQLRIKQLPGASEHLAPRLPTIGETITWPFLVDPTTLQPVPVIVSDIRPMEDGTIAVVITRAQ